eukprot:SAG22_NODE_554_length_9135_cov_3.635569_6_plen_200_part_00
MKGEGRSVKGDLHNDSGTSFDFDGYSLNQAESTSHRSRSTLRSSWPRARSSRKQWRPGIDWILFALSDKLLRRRWLAGLCVRVCARVRWACECVCVVGGEPRNLEANRLLILHVIDNHCVLFSHIISTRTAVGLRRRPSPPVTLVAQSSVQLGAGIGVFLQNASIDAYWSSLSVSELKPFLKSQAGRQTRLVSALTPRL